VCYVHAYLYTLRYNIVKRLGSGGFGAVYGVIGEDNNKYALKELENFNSVNKDRFEREIRILSELDHPNIVKITQWNVGGDPPSFTPYYVMEYLSGGSLREHMDKKFSHGELFESKWTINKIILPICNALAQAHSEKIYHRDLKPDNIIYTTPNKYEIKVTDWGLGKDVKRESIALTAVVGGLGGTPIYCAPEQWFGRDNVDGRADIFSIGIIFYEMLTSRKPIAYEDNNNTLEKMVVQPPSTHRSSISSKLDRSIMKMIEIEPEKRYTSVWDLIAEIETLPENYS
jgi:serine/threonine protein kinase